MKTASKTIIFFSDDAFATAILTGLQPTPSSPLQISKESFDLPLVQYGIIDTRASGSITHFVDASGVSQVSILVLRKYESPILACAISEVLASLAGEDTSTVPSFILPFLVDSSKLKSETKESLDENIYGIQIGPQTDVIQTLARRYVDAPSSMRIHHEPLSCALQLFRVQKKSSIFIIGTHLDDFETICEIGQSLANSTSMQFVKDKVTWNPTKVSKEPEKEPWRALYG